MTNIKKNGHLNYSPTLMMHCQTQINRRICIGVSYVLCQNCDFSVAFIYIKKSI